jgi:flagellar biosynthetic protein FliO
MESVQQAFSVLVVLCLLGGTLWWLRRKGIAALSFRAPGGAKHRSIQVVERMALTPQHSLHLVQVEGRTMLIAASPGGCTILADGVELR